MTRQHDADPDAEDDEYEDDDPTDPRHPDYDLSESVPYAPYEPPSKPWFMRRLALIVTAIIVIAGLFIPYLQNIF